MNRRTALILSTIGAAAMGSGYALWRETSVRADPGVAEALGTSFEDTSGRLQALSQWRGHPLVVNFWATWCPPCIEEMPMLDRVRAAYIGKGAEIIGIGVDAPDAIRAYQARFGFHFPVLIGGSGGRTAYTALGNYGNVLPYTVLITPAGSIARRWIGLVPEQSLRDALDGLLKGLA